MADRRTHIDKEGPFRNKYTSFNKGIKSKTKNLFSELGKIVTVELFNLWKSVTQDWQFDKNVCEKPIKIDLSDALHDSTSWKSAKRTDQD